MSVNVVVILNFSCLVKKGREMRVRLCLTAGVTILANIFAVESAAAQSERAPSSWSGTYISVLGIGSASTISGTSRRGDGEFGANADEEKANTSFRGGGAGILFGYQHQYSNGIIAGLEADWSWLSLKGTQDSLVDTVGNPYYGMLMASNTRETQWSSTARLLLGYGEESWMINATAGLATASMLETRTQYKGFSSPSRTEAQFTEKSQAIPLGYAVGVTGSWRVSDKWALRADYLLTQFDQVHFSFPNARGGVASSYSSVQGRSIHNDISLHMFRVGVTYSF